MIDGIVQAAADRTAVALVATVFRQAMDLVTVGPVRATPTDFLRLLVVPIYGWAAYRDVRTRRVPNETWIPLALFGIALLAVDAWTALEAGPRQAEQFVQWAGLSIGFVIPLSYLFWRIGGFGGADAKALMVLTLLLPTFPAYLFLPPLAEPIGSLPLERPPVEAFSFTVLTNGVLVGIVYPLAVTLRNAVAGRFAPVMFVGRPVAVEAVPDTYGRLLETPEGTTRRGLDLDALRMYLQWRGVALSDLRADPDRYRNPESLPAEPNAPGDGAITDGGRPEDGNGNHSEESGGTSSDGDESASGSRESSERVRDEDLEDEEESSVEDAQEEGLEDGEETSTEDARDEDLEPTAEGDGTGGGSADDLVDPGMFGAGDADTDESETAGTDLETEPDGPETTRTDPDESETAQSEAAQTDPVEPETARTDPDGPDEEESEPVASGRQEPRPEGTGRADQVEVGGAGSVAGPEPVGSDRPAVEDPWGAEAFLDDVGGAYGTTPDDLRDGLEVLVENEDVWVSPGLPFLVPVFLGLLVAFVYGDVLFGLLELAGVA